MFVTQYINAAYPFLYVRTLEQERAVEHIVNELTNSGLLDTKLYLWKCTNGLVPLDGQERSQPIVGADFMQLLRFMEQEQQGRNNVYLILNPKPYLENKGAQNTAAAYAIIQQMRDCAASMRTRLSTAIFVGADVNLHLELQDIVTMLDFNLPTKEEIKAIFKAQLEASKAIVEKMPSDDELDLAADASIGLTEFKAENAIALSIATTRGLDMELLQHEKELAVRQLEVIEYIRDLDSLDNVGGFDYVKDHVKKRTAYFKRKHQAEAFGCSPPKGILLCGVAGTGKSLVAKAIARYMGLRLYSFNVGAVFKSLVGASEAMIRNALRTAETLAPCVLVFDEYEKMLAGLESSSASDGGTTSRVIAYILTWMQECKAPIYKIATCNTIHNLDAALFRRGRWDAMFGVDLPSPAERGEIFKIHLRKRKRNPKDFDLHQLVMRSKDMVGAEIESAVEEALYDAFYKGEQMTTAHILDVLQEIKPLALTDMETMTAFRRWITERAQPASPPDAPFTTLATKTRTVLTLKKRPVRELNKPDE